MQGPYSLNELNEQIIGLVPNCSISNVLDTAILHYAMKI